MRSWKTAVLAAMAVLSFAACDIERQRRLEEGVSTEGDVRLLWGQPNAVIDNPDGTKTMEYTRQPEGQTNYFLVIGSDGKLASMRQVLKSSEFAKIVAGMSKDDVRKTLGRPAKSIRYDLKPDEENWEWRWLDGQAPKVFIATFDRDNKITKTQTIDDPASTMPGGK